MAVTGRLDSSRRVVSKWAVSQGKPMSQQEQNVIVLVADDEPSTLALVASHVRGKGYMVLEASDGDQAWQLAHEHLPDLVILDVMMPGMSGWEVCRKIREAVSLAHTGVIMLTGIGENLNEMTSPLYGADTYLDKPFEFSTLDQKIVETLAERRDGAMGRPDPEVAARKSSHPPAPRNNGATPALAKASTKEKAAPRPKRPDAVMREAAMPLVKATRRKAPSRVAKAAKAGKGKGAKKAPRAKAKPAKKIAQAARKKAAKSAPKKKAISRKKAKAAPKKTAKRSAAPKKAAKSAKKTPKKKAAAAKKAAAKQGASPSPAKKRAARPKARPSGNATV
jgi:CheY-like chemotaxis protein